MIIRKKAVNLESTAEVADTLTAALPWIRSFQGETIVIKFGGNAMVDPLLFERFAEDVLFLRMAGVNPVIVHGGGPQINEMLEKLGIEPEFRGGYRVTDEATVDIVRMVLTGSVNPKIVGAINKNANLAVGLSGADGGLFQAEQKPPVDTPEGTFDLGFVGDITAVNAKVIETLSKQGLIPVVSSIAAHPENSAACLNINADTAAAALAAELKAAKMILLTDVPGLYQNWPDQDTLISSLTVDELDELLPSLTGGMVPKLIACRDAMTAGVKKVAIVDGRVPHATLLELLTDDGIGTEIVSA